MRDHPELSFHVPQALNEARAQKANPVIVKDHFTNIYGKEKIKYNNIYIDSLNN